MSRLTFPQRSQTGLEFRCFDWQWVPQLGRRELGALRLQLAESKVQEARRPGLIKPAHHDRWMNRAYSPEHLKSQITLGVAQGWNYSGLSALNLHAPRAATMSGDLFP